MMRRTFGQADAGALKLARPVQALEDAEELVDILRVKTNAVVAHEEDDGVLAWRSIGVPGCHCGRVRGFFQYSTTPILHHSNLNHCRVARASVFNGIAQQVGQDLSEHRVVAPHRGQRRCFPDDVPAARVSSRL